MYYLTTFFIWFIQQYQKYNFYENLILDNEIDPDYINQLQTINNKIQVYKETTKHSKF